jgi:hypothetical protein
LACSQPSAAIASVADPARIAGTPAASKRTSTAAARAGERLPSRAAAGGRHRHDDRGDHRDERHDGEENDGEAKQPADHRGEV